jgi:hypothetical protein
MEKDNCYVLEDGTCISPFKCIHGPALSIKDFLEEAETAECLDNATKWYDEKMKESKYGLQQT